MVEFIIGTAGTGKTSRCLSDIQQQLQKFPEGTPLLMILPEHMTFKIERRLAILMNDKGGFSRAFIFGFRRLCQNILNREGGAITPHITETGKNLLLSRIVLEHKDELTALAKAARQRNFTVSLNTIISELKTYGVSASALQKTAKTLTDEALQQKLNDISILYDAFNAATDGHYNDSEDMLAAAAQKITASGWLNKCEIWIDGFIFFNPQELAILKALFKIASTIHVTLCIDSLQDTANSNETALFHRQYQTYQEIQSICHELNLKTKITLLTATPRFLMPAQKAIARNMFYFPLKKAAEADGIIIAEAANRRLEAEAAAIDIIRLCREEKFTYNDIGIITRDPSYDFLLQAVLNDYQIPFFSDSKRLFIHHPLAELLRSCLEAVRTWQYEPLMRCFKTDFFPVTRDDVDSLENYCLEFGIRGKKQWLSAEDWHYTRRPLSDEPLSVEETDYLAKIDNIRRRLTASLQLLSTGLKNAATARDITQVLYQFLTLLNVPDKLTLWQKQAENSGELALAEEQQQIWCDVVELFDEIVETCGDEELSLKEYSAILNDGLESLQIALIPPGLDYVTLASFDQNSLENKNAIYIIGANDGIMPRRVKNEGLLTDSDRLYLCQSGINLPNGTGADNFLETFLLYKAFTLSRCYLWVSYALADTEGTALNKSMLIDRLRFILPLKKNQLISVLLGNNSAAGETQYVVTPRRSISHLTMALRQYKEKATLADFWFDVYNWLLNQPDYQAPLFTALAGLFTTAPDTLLPPGLTSRLYTKNGFLSGSVTRFEEFHNCPFKHFANYALKLSERREFNFAAPDRGILLHETMRTFGELLLQQKRRWNEITRQERHVLCQKIVAELSSRLQNKILLSTRQYHHLTKRIAQTAEQAINRLSEFSAHSDFSTIALEKAFGAGSISLPPLIYDLDNNHKISLIGQIDRIDADSSGRYFLIIDYKSGNAYINLTEVYYGLRLQLLTYLLAVQNGAQNLKLAADTIPAGILYCFLKSTLLTFDRQVSDEQIKTELIKRMRMPGWVLMDPDVIKKIDDSASFIKVRFNRDGSISKISRSTVKSTDEFNALLEYMDKLLVDTGNRILSGENSVTPYKLKQNVACTFCPYMALCRFDITVPGYHYNELPDLDDDTIMRHITNKTH
ncbi:helicase-exonuclease AddAB subunit AddB [Pectinatus frisingensis]|uniref:helicase-exonuclease AddAB subunit AddB n=1 Tax=Pectinatus frisingensis TaxID=865 RepID=UPI003D8050B8